MRRVRAGASSGLLPYVVFLPDLVLSGLQRRVAGFDVHHPGDIDAGSGDLLRRQLAQFGDVLRLYDRQLGRRRHDRIEVPPGVAVDEVAPTVGAPRLDQCNIAVNRVFEDVFAPVKDAALLALGQLGAGGGRRVEGRDAGRGGAQPLRHRALRQYFELDLTAGIDLLEQDRAAAARKAADDLPDPALADQPRHAFAPAPGGVMDDGQFLGAGLDEPVDQGPRLADLGEAGDQHGRAVLDAGQGLRQ